MVAPGNRKEKGERLARRVVDDHQEIGLAAERVPYQSNRSKGRTSSGDVSIPIVGLDLPVECKHWKDGFEPVYRALGNAAVACIKANNKEELYVIRRRTWLDLVKLAESYRAPPISEAAE